MFPLKRQLQLNKGHFMYKVLNDMTPTYLSQLFQYKDNHFASWRNELEVIRPRLDLFKTCLSYSGALLWNSLPATIKYASSPQSFKRKFYDFICMKNILN